MKNRLLKIVFIREEPVLNIKPKLIGMQGRTRLFFINSSVAFNQYFTNSHIPLILKQPFQLL